MKRTLLYLSCNIVLLTVLIGCMDAEAVRKSNINAFKTPEIVGEIDGHELYHYQIYARYGDSYTIHNVYYVKGKNTITTNGPKPKHVNIVVDGVEYAPAQSQTNE